MEKIINLSTLNNDQLSNISGGKIGGGWFALVDPAYNLVTGLYDGWKSKHK